MDEKVTLQEKQEFELPDLCRLVAECSPLPMAAVAGAGHIIRYVNPAFCLLTDRTREELIGKAFSHTAPTGGECLALLGRVYQTGQAEAHSGQEDPGAHRLYWSYVMWPVLAAEGHRVGIMIQVIETTPFLLQATRMNNALMIGSVRQHELTAAAEELNAQLQAEITERQKIEQQLRASERSLSRLLQEKQTLVQEIHHRVKNNLQMVVSLLSLHAGQANDPPVVEALSEAGGRIQAIARLHEALYASETLAEVNFGDYLQHLTNELQHLQGRAEITVEVFTEDMVLGMDTAIPLGLIANELILNCLKHAFPAGREGRMTVSVEYVRDSVKSGESLDPAALRLRVEDNGRGLPPGLDIHRTDSLGLRLVQLLTRQLHAELQAQTGVGLSWTVTVPPPAPSPEQGESYSGKSPHSDRGG
jgi:two-component system, NtrC family, sensor kinase